ncbi:MAG: hypothetical protein MUE82_12550 [Chloroflexi bacterium]|nr:hypothetical protein [Chloroflexota bacterium]
MPLLLVKIVLTPVLIGTATLAARRWGPTVGGLLIALPLTSGPVLLFMSLDQGTGFAAEAAVGSLVGLAAIAAFCVAYAWTDRRAGVAASVAAGTVAFAVAGTVLHAALGLPLWLVVVIVVAAIAGATLLVPRSGLRHGSLPHPAWDLPMRMLVATGLVVGVTALAPVLGPGWSGIVATFPVYLAVMAAFTQRHAGAAAADDVLRGLLAGLYGTAAFYVVVTLGLEAIGIGATFAAAVVIALAIEAVALRIARPGVTPEPA